MSEVVRKKISNKLIDLGLKPHVRGFDLIVDLIEIYSQNRNTVLNDAYKKLGQKYGIALDTVNTNLRYALNDLNAEALGYEKHVKFSNKRFIKTFVAKYL